MEKNFHDRLSEYSQSGNTNAIDSLLMRELGVIAVKNRKDFIALLNESGISANENMSDNELVNLYANNIVNQRLLLGTAFLINMHNKTIGADGENAVSDEGVKTTYSYLCSNFLGEENDLEDEDFANAGGVVGAIAGAVGEGAKFGGKLAENRRSKKYGAQDFLQKQQDAKNQLSQSIIETKKAQIEATNKKIADQKKIQKIALISGAVIAGIGIIAFVIYQMKSKK